MQHRRSIKLVHSAAAATQPVDSASKLRPYANQLYKSKEPKSMAGSISALVNKHDRLRHNRKSIWQITTTLMHFEYVMSSI